MISRLCHAPPRNGLANLLNNGVGLFNQVTGALCVGMELKRIIVYIWSSIDCSRVSNKVFLYSGCLFLFFFMVSLGNSWELPHGFCPPLVLQWSPYTPWLMLSHAYHTYFCL